MKKTKKKRRTAGPLLPTIVRGIYEVLPFELYDRVALRVRDLEFNESAAGVTAQFVAPQPALLFQESVTEKKYFTQTNLLGCGGQLPAGEKMNVTMIALQLLEDGSPAHDSSPIWWNSYIKFSIANIPRLIAPASRFLRDREIALDVELESMLHFSLLFESAWAYHPHRKIEVLARLVGKLTRLVIP